MPAEAAARSHGQQGFTLIELVTVIVIIGILAAIALPVFLHQRSKGQDAAAKSDARNLVSLAESCFSSSGDYSNCTTIIRDGGLEDTGNVNTFTPSPSNDGYVIKSVSKTRNAFLVTKSASGRIVRTCTTVGGEPGGGCTGNEW